MNALESLRYFIPEIVLLSGAFLVLGVDFFAKNKRMVVGESVQITSDPNAPAVRFDEKDILKKYALSYADLTNKLRERYYRFKTDKKYHRIRKRLITDNKFALTRYLDPNNPKGTKKVFYSLMIVKEFDKHYKRSRKRKLVK